MELPVPSPAAPEPKLSRGYERFCTTAALGFLKVALRTSAGFKTTALRNAAAFWVVFKPPALIKTKGRSVCEPHVLNHREN